VTPSSSQRGVALADAPTRDGWTENVLARGETLVANALFAYGAVLVIQLRVIWNMWQYRDLTSGDTAGYFTVAVAWANELRVNLVWSPLYTSFWGTIHAAVGDVYAGAIAHRVAIVLAAGILVLALLRAVLEPALALLLAVWWVVLPANYDFLYEVHLFGLLPVLLAVLVVRRSPGRPALGVALAILAGATLLVRNELAIATAMVGVAIVIREVRARRRDRASLSHYALAYGVPLAVVCLLLVGANSRAYKQGGEAWAEVRAKHALNVCQAYAVNYQQRHPTRFTGNPFLDCRPLMEETFGRPMPSFLQATRANPRAMAKYIAWNGRLLPTGLQLSLFGATVTGDNPDYRPVEDNRLYPLVLSLALIALLIAGTVVLVRDREHWRLRLLPARWAFVVLGSVALTTLFVVALTQRPRPGYIYGLTVALLMLTGLCASALLRRWRGRRFAALAALGIVVAMAVGLSSRFHPAPRPLHHGVERLEVVRGLLRQPGSVLVTARDGLALCHYLSDGPGAHCSAPRLATFTSKVGRDRSLGDVLDAVGATVVYEEAALRFRPAFAGLLASPETFGWRRIAEGTGPDGAWGVLVRDGVLRQTRSSADSSERFDADP
jgi:hypothetical protein